MDTHLAGLVKKYLNDQCTPDEARLVLQYFTTREGQAYLSRLIDEDIEQIDDLIKKGNRYEADDELILSKIHHNILEEQRSRKEKVVKKHPWYWVAAIIVAVLAVGWAYQFFFTQRFITQQTAFGETKRIKLADGTAITLNANSTLRYPSDYQQNREVWLQGEAFFEVMPVSRSNATSPSKERIKFTVHTERLLVEVTGTSFNINDRQDKTQVVLNTGKIQLKAQALPQNQPDIVEMEPGDMVEVLAGDGKILKKVVNPEVYSSWKDYKLVCYDTPLKVIAQVIQNNYGKQVVFKDPDLSAMVVTGTLPTNHLDLLLEVLAESMQLEIQKSEQAIYIEKK